MWRSNAHASVAARFHVGDEAATSPAMTQSPAHAEHSKTRVASISILASAAMAAAKLVVGIGIGSLALISEALHSGVDVVATDPAPDQEAEALEEMDDLQRTEYLRAKGILLMISFAIQRFIYMSKLIMNSQHLFKQTLQTLYLPISHCHSILRSRKREYQQTNSPALRPIGYHACRVA